MVAWTVLVTPLSIAIGEYFAYYDPQSDPERLQYHRDLAAHVYTAGHWAGQLVAALAGAWLVVRAGGYHRAVVLHAALTGGLLALVTGTVAVAAGAGRMLEHGYPSVAPDPTMLTEPAVLGCLVASLVCFPLWALLGAAIAGLTRRRPLLVVVATVLCQPATVLLTVGLAAPPSSHPLAVSLIASDGRAALAMPAILLLWTAALTAAATAANRRRR
ncbi:hypothetical protein GCM10023107_89950 [Actinoplanes octamycinicus]|nr:hypothetical protein Aoc01nite_65350 [Actinoplanes octamycinicus]